ncbi:TPA: hypothetical protein DDW35_10245 [Candidatus Sumerlaeota bacterium]|nr:hypothetical protein [Candidatus Sumerlaeota bacterium]
MRDADNSPILELSVHESQSRLPALLRAFFIFDLHFARNFGKLWNDRYLLYALTLRGIRGRYKQSMLGVGWALLTPAAMTFVFSYMLSRTGISGRMVYPCPMALYTLCMLTFWNLFSRSITNGSTALVSNMDLVTKVYFPREVLPIASVLMNLVDWFVAFLMYVFVAAVGTNCTHFLAKFSPNLATQFAGDYHFYPHANWLWVPVLMVLLLLFINGLVFIAATLQVYFRDVAHLINLAVFLWLFMTPVLYPLRAIAGGRASTLIIFNPVTGLLDGIQMALISGHFPWEHHVLFAAAVSVFIFLAGYSFFKHEERFFADVV